MSSSPKDVESIASAARVSSPSLAAPPAAPSAAGGAGLLLPDVGGIVHAQSQQEIADQQVRRRSVPRIVRASGVENIDEVFIFPDAFHFVFLRGHFAWQHGESGSASFNDVAMSLEAVAGDEYNTEILKVEERGIGRDLFFVVEGEQVASPSGWFLSAGDGLRVAWTNTDSALWGIELGVVEV